MVEIFKNSSGQAGGSILSSNSRISELNIDYGRGIRPVISLIHDIVILGGSGVAIDPWIVE